MTIAVSLSLPRQTTRLSFSLFSALSFLSLSFVFGLEGEKREEHLDILRGGELNF